mgnify:CR=1 FL=1
MSAEWFFTNYPPSRSVIENDLRLKFWFGGFKGMWLSCTKETVPYECQSNWNGNAFSMEWEPKNYLLVKMKTPNQQVLDVFERMLGHKALAAYKNADGTVIVEWRTKNADARFQELQTSGASELERLDK